MSPRRFFLLNPVNYKVKKIFWVVAFCLISNILIFLASAYFITNEYKGESDSLVMLKSAIDTENQLVSRYIKAAVENPSSILSEDTEKMSAEHKQSLGIIDSHIKSIENRKNSVNRFFSGFIVIVTMITLILFLIIVMIFSKIIGPIYHINHIITDYLKGEEVHFRPIREGDEFEELYTNVVHLIEKKEK